MTTSDPIGRFLAHALRRPDHPAVEQDERVVTYGELAAMARRLALRLAGFVAPRVLLAVPQGPEAYAAILGTLLGGGTYIPVNLAAPGGKLLRVAEIVQPDVIVAAPDLAEKLAAASPRAMRIDPDTLSGGAMLEGEGRRHDDAYVIFTSGSTGVPKGVVIPSAALAHYIGWLDQAGVMRQTDRVSQFPSIGFDLSVLDIHGALNAGATLVTPAGSGDRLFPGEFVRRSGITVWVSVPSMVGLAMSGRQATAAMLGGVRSFLFCGEPLLRSHLEALFGACPDGTVTNLYGPTEATCSMTAVALRAGAYDAACGASVAFGDAIPGMGLHLVGGAHPDEGEIVITGPQLAREYWQDPGRTAQLFRPVELPGGAVRGYWTGDWGERRGGHVFFKFRIDHQVKLHGYRIETGEIVARLADLGWPVSCVVKHGEKLVAVVELAEGQNFDPDRLRSRLFEELDAYAVPEIIYPIANMPRNSSHKTDQAAVRLWLDSATNG